AGPGDITGRYSGLRKQRVPHPTNACGSRLFGGPVRFAVGILVLVFPAVFASQTLNFVFPIVREKSHERTGIDVQSQTGSSRSQSRFDALAPDDVEQQERRSGRVFYAALQLRNMTRRQVEIVREHGLAHVRALAQAANLPWRQRCNRGPFARTKMPLRDLG